MVDKELIEQYRKTVKPVVASWLSNINYEHMGEQDKEEFERDFDEILDLALIGLKYKAQLSQEDATKGTTFSCGHENDTISRQAAIDAINTWPKFGLDGYGRMVPWKYVHLEDVMQAIKNIPTEQPETNSQKRTVRNFRTVQPCNLLATDCCNLLATDCISRQAAIDAVNNIMPTKEGFYEPSEVLCELMQLPPAQPEREKGEWIEALVAGMPAIHHEKCGAFVYAPNGKKGFNFCPNCGAKMENRDDT